MTRSLLTTVPSFPHLAEAAGFTQKRFPQRFPQVAITLLRSLMSLTFLALGALAECTVQCTQSLLQLLSPAVVSQARQSLTLIHLKTRFGTSQNQLTFQPNLAAHGSPILLDPVMKKMRERIDPWFFGIRHQDGMNNCSVGASTSVGGWLLHQSRISSWLLQLSLQLVRPHHRSHPRRPRQITIRLFCNLAKLARICSQWITGILCLHFRLLRSAWVVSTPNWHVNRRK